MTKIRSLKIFICILLLLKLSGCSTLSPPKDENSHLYGVPAGSKVILHQDLQIKPNSARVYLRNGEVSNKPGGKSYCQFKVNDVIPEEQTLHADEFIVRKTQMGTVNITMHDPLIVASRDNKGTSDVTLVWYLWLESPQQPNVRLLTCGGTRQMPHRARRLSINEIRTHLGDIASLVILDGEES